MGEGESSTVNEKIDPKTVNNVVFLPVILCLCGGAFVWRRYWQKHRRQHEKPLTESEVVALINEWQPEPLASAVPLEHYALNKKIVQGKMGHYISIDGKNYLNMAGMDFLGLIGDKRIETVAKATIQKYGVGSCGPRGFYGTVDVHLELEKQIAEFMNCEESALYSYGFATITSAIPAYAKRGDVIFVDKGVNFAIQKGLVASRSRVVWFNHNDVVDLQNKLEEQAVWDKKNPAKAARMRRFMIVEGIYLNSGKICPLPDLIELKWKYKVRIFVDESVSFGVLGATGRGVTEHYGANIEDVDMIMASLELAVASTGGFCVGRSFVIEHHRLSGLGYCFSASLPPLLATSAGESLRIINAEPERLLRLQARSTEMLQYLQELMHTSDFWDADADAGSPVIHVTYKKSQLHASDNKDNELQAEIDEKLDALVNHAHNNGVLLTRARYLLDQEHFPVTPRKKYANSNFGNSRRPIP